MSIRVYISHTDPVEALTAAKDIMERGGFPFVPQLNKLVVGRSDEEWTRYYRLWMLQCDVVLLTRTFRAHEKSFAIENKIPIAWSPADAMSVSLPPYAELGREFGSAVSTKLPPKEEWRYKAPEDVEKAFKQTCGLGADPLTVAAIALQAWDLRRRGAQ